MQLLKFIILSLVTLLIFSNNLTDKERINYLLNEVKNSDALFFRNGEKHTAKEAYKHINFKLNYVKKAFFFFGPEKDIPINDFIEKIASKSSSTGKEYYIQEKGKEKVSVKKWMRKKLRELNDVSKAEFASKKDDKIK